MGKTFDVKYERGHSYTETWDKTAHFCPHCSQPTVWMEAGEGDYYQGPAFLCVNCGGGFYLPYEPRKECWQDIQRIAGIKKEADRGEC